MNTFKNKQKNKKFSCKVFNFEKWRFNIVKEISKYRIQFPRKLIFKWKKFLSYLFASKTINKKIFLLDLLFHEMKCSILGHSVYTTRDTESPFRRFFDGNPRPRYFVNAKVLICRFPSNDQWQGRCLIDSTRTMTWMQTATWWCAKCKIARWKLCMHLCIDERNGRYRAWKFEEKRGLCE